LREKHLDEKQHHFIKASLEVLCITVSDQVRKDTCLVGAHSFASRSRSSCGQFRVSQ